MLSHRGRDRRRGPRLPLELLVKHQTSENADFFGLSDRGRLAPGAACRRKPDRLRSPAALPAKSCGLVRSCPDRSRTHAAQGNTEAERGDRKASVSKCRGAGWERVGAPLTRPALGRHLGGPGQLKRAGDALACQISVASSDWKPSSSGRKMQSPAAGRWRRGLPALPGSQVPLYSINKGRFLVDRYGGTILANVRSIGVNRQRHDGSPGGEQEDERHCCDEGLHDWSPLALDENRFRTPST